MGWKGHGQKLHGIKTPGNKLHKTLPSWPEQVHPCQLGQIEMKEKVLVDVSFYEENVPFILFGHMAKSSGDFVVKD